MIVLVRDQVKVKTRRSSYIDINRIIIVLLMFIISLYIRNQSSLNSGLKPLSLDITLTTTRLYTVWPRVWKKISRTFQVPGKWILISTKFSHRILKK